MSTQNSYYLYRKLIENLLFSLDGVFVVVLGEDGHVELVDGALLLGERDDELVGRADLPILGLE